MFFIWIVKVDTEDPEDGPGFEDTYGVGDDDTRNIADAPGKLWSELEDLDS